MDTFRTDLRKLYTLFGTDSRNLGQRGQEPHPLQRLIPLRIGHNIIREYPPGRAFQYNSRFSSSRNVLLKHVALCVETHGIKLQGHGLKGPIYPWRKYFGFALRASESN